MASSLVISRPPAIPDLPSSKSEQEDILLPPGIEPADILLSNALQHLTHIHPDYRILPLATSFNWQTIASLLPSTISKTWYIVAFRSIRRADASTEELYAADAEAHREARESGGILKYWYGDLNEKRECLAMCVWANRGFARQATRKPHHVRAMMLTARTYETYRLEKYWLIKEEGVEGFRLEENTLMSDHIGLAIGLTAAAGGASIIGGALGLLFSRDKYIHFLPFSLAFAAGVMLFISLTEVYSAMREHLRAAALKGELPIPFGVASILLFFGGMLLIAGFQYLVDLIGDHKALEADNTLEVQECAAANHDTAFQLAPAVEAGKLEQKEKKRLLKLSLFVAIAIGLHNIPEGLATFISTLAEPSLGVPVAIAIAIHNIPEGMCIAMPVFFATNSRWKAILWASVAAVSEPLGGLIGYGVWSSNKGSISDFTFAVLFGIVSGMMTYVSLVELIPTAFRFRGVPPMHVSMAMICGFVVMALSIMLVEL
ncbi:Zinc transporter [Quaeritorhiza haematococci]|nr:Zinc transporter [Quaeritorhiza haematococci]